MEADSLAAAGHVCVHPYDYLCMCVCLLSLINKLMCILIINLLQITSYGFTCRTISWKVNVLGPGNVFFTDVGSVVIHILIFV